MKIRFNVLGAQLLLALNIFIAFLLIFETRLFVPAWLQPVGRMHPLLLHFPIVILSMSMLLEFFRSRKDLATNSFFVAASDGLAISGALLAGVTVLMGLLLSREEGYEGNTLVRHKWTGVFIFFMASLVCWLKTTKWYSGPVAKTTALVMMSSVIISGHYGAELTHGENFISGPLEVYNESEPVAYDQAIVFDHVIKPILEKKCIGCHNPDKLKGGLLLMDSASIMKGGKSGALLIPGNPAMGLFLQRVHLDIDDKKHMPPAGKPQLTDAETVLLTAWIRKGHNLFSQKVSELPENDSLKIASMEFLQPPGGGRYDFAAADERTISKLNNDYRTITPLAIGSPALSVNLYNREVYSKKMLEELGDVQKQVVAINLNKLPVKDEDLKIVSRFVNLRYLYLNFTDISAAGLTNLARLEHLFTLAISGTQIDYEGLKKLLPQLKALKTVFVWNTLIKSEEIAKLQKAKPDISFVDGFKDDGANPLKLNPPQVKNPSIVFRDSIRPQLSHPIKGVEIRYTTDGTDPDSSSSMLFDGKAVLTKNTYIKARAFKDGWYSSDVAGFYYLKCSIRPDSSRLLFQLNHVHRAAGANTFFDTKLGVIGANNPAWANNWAGVRDNDLALVSFFDKAVAIGEVGLHYMVEENTGIYPPALVEVWGGENEKRLRLLATMRPSLPKKDERPSLKTIEAKFKPHTVSCLKIVAKPYRKRKDRYLLLVDEMYLNN